MSQNNTWMHYLNIGLIISSFILILGCKEETKTCLARAEFFYENQTAHELKIPIGNIHPGDTLIYELSLSVECDVTRNSYISPLTEGSTIYFNNTHCITYNSTAEGVGEGPVGIGNYKSKRVERNRYRFTYIFTEEDYEKAEPCEYTISAAYPLPY